MKAKQHLVTLDYSDDAAARTFYDKAWLHPQTPYVVQPVDAAVAREWIRNNASMVNFGWGAGPFPPMCKGQVMHMDELFYRHRCGWVHSCAESGCASDVWHGNNGYVCDYPPDEHCEIDTESGKRLCIPFQCPVAYEADREDLRRKYHSLWESDYRDYPDEQPTDWMILCERPRYAAVSNVTVLGVDKEQS